MAPSFVRGQRPPAGDVSGKMCLVAVDIGLRGILRRLGLESRANRSVTVPVPACRTPYRLAITSSRSNQALPADPDHITTEGSKLHPADSRRSQRGLAEGADVDLRDLDVETAAAALHELEPGVQADIIETCQERLSDI